MMEYYQDGLDELAATVIRTAYEDLIRAMLFDAMVEHKDESYNCANRYHEFTRPKKRRRYNVYSKTIESQHSCAKRDINRLRAWFLKGEKFRMMSKDAKGEWFVGVAEEKVQEWIDDRCMEIDLSVLIDGHDAEWYRLKRLKWQGERDKWRKEHGLSEVDDG